MPKPGPPGKEEGAVSASLRCVCVCWVGLVPSSVVGVVRGKVSSGVEDTVCSTTLGTEREEGS